MPVQMRAAFIVRSKTPPLPAKGSFASLQLNGFAERCAGKSRIGRNWDNAMFAVEIRTCL